MYRRKTRGAISVGLLFVLIFGMQLVVLQNILFIYVVRGPWTLFHLKDDFTKETVNV